MNERIKELLTQAISDVDYIHFDKAIDKELAQMYIPDCFAEQFAQLIVQECARSAKEWYENHDLIHSDPMSYMLAHFGVEE